MESLLKTVLELGRTVNDGAWSFSKSILHNLPTKTVPNGFVGVVPGAVFSEVQPDPLPNPKLFAVCENCMRSLLDMDPKIAKTEQFVEFVSGNRILPNAVMLSHRYGGHQFGYWAAQLGDGRAILLGEYVNRNNERWELQLKGSGRTPYSRFGDGRAVLRSSVREFLCSEHMHSLGIATSRALSLVVSDSTVMRDMFYDDRPNMEKTAIVLRLAPSWFRIGSLEIHFMKKEHDILRQLANFVIEHHYPHIWNTDQTMDEKYLQFYAEVVDKTARMIAGWMSVGFAHGVMNTDNFSLLGLTIDYGPFGFQESYNPFMVPNSSDDQGRYAYNKQPEIAMFNLHKMRVAMEPLFERLANYEQTAKIEEQFEHLYELYFMESMRKKLGLTDVRPEDRWLIDIFHNMMAETGADFTMSFRELSELTTAQLASLKKASDIPLHLWALRRLVQHESWPEFARKYAELSIWPTESERQSQMNAANPRYILRNWMAESVIRNESEIELNLLLRVLTQPFTEQKDAEAAGYSKSGPDWAAKIRVSCSS